MERKSLFGEDMEFFNGTEWKKISEYKKNEKILMYELDTRKAILATPLKYIKQKSKGLNLLSQGKNAIKFYVSDEALFIGDSRDNNTIKRFTLKNSYDGGFHMFNHTLLYNTFQYDGKSCMLSKPKLKIMILSLLIGEIKDNICSIETNNKDLIRLLKEARVKYKNVKTRNGTFVRYKLPRDKELFLENPLSFTTEEIYTMIDFINMIPKEKNKKLFLKEDKMLDFFQMIYALHGDKSIIKDEELYISNVSYTRLDSRYLTTEYKKAHYQYSFTTRTHFIILRTRGYIFIFGDYKA